MLTRLKRAVKDWVFVAGVLAACVIFIALIFGGIAFEILKAVAVVKYIFS